MNDRVSDLQPRSRIVLSGLVLDLAAGELLTRDGQLAGLRKQALEVLLVLGRQTGQVVTKDELMRLVWPSAVVGEGSLTQAIGDIRRVLDDKEHRVVRNVARRGYMLVPDAAPAVATPAASISASEAHPRDTTGRGMRMVLAGALAAVSIVAISAWWSGALSPVDRGNGMPALSIVVLPLASDGADPDSEWFADVLHGDLTSELGQISGTSVISRETAATFKSGPVDPRAVAKQLQVRYVVRGSVRRHGDRVHLRLAMIDGASGAQHWTNQFDLERAELRASLVDIARQVARSLSVQMYRSSGERSARLAPEHAQADDLAMQGFAIYFRGMTPENLTLAGAKFESALRMDPGSIRAWGGVQAVTGVAASLAWIPRDKAIVRLEEAARRLQELDEDDYYAYSAKLFLAFLKGDWESQLVTSTAAIERFPSHPASQNHHSLALAALGDFEACIGASRKAVRLGPRDNSVGISYMVMATCHFMLEEYREAAAIARAAHQANPAYPSPPVLLAASLVRAGEMAEARAIVSGYLRRNPSYQASDIGKFLRGRHPRYLAGRDRVIESLRAAGMP